ncbi:MAG: HDOD domain-containing protein, partial [Caldimicrobium sp.]
MGELEKLLRKENKTLLPFPKIGIKILQTFLTKSPREIEEFLITEKEIAQILITVANLPKYHKGEVPIENPRQVILVLGEDTAKILALGLISQKLIKHTFNEFSFPKFWARALSQLVAGFYFADLIENYPSHIPISAYFLDFGILVLYLLNPEKYLQVLRLKKEGKSLLSAEEEIFGVNHALVGAEYFENYALPRRFILNIRHHHNEEEKEGLPPEILEDCMFLRMIDHGVGSFFS